MPSQISLRTSPVQVGQKVVHSSGEDDMKAAARTVGSLLVAHSAAVRKPPRCDVASVNCNGCGKSGSPSGVLNMGHHSSTDALTAANPEPKHGRVNGMVETWSLRATPPPCRTCGEPSSSKSMDSMNHSNRDWLMCPELAIGYTGSLMGKRMASLATKQRDLERRVSLLQHKVRLGQLSVVHLHACKQLSFDSNEQGSFSIGQTSTSSLNGSSSSVDSHPLDRREVLPLPIQVDGASDDAFFLSRQVRGKEQSPELAKVEQWQGLSQHGLEEEEEEESFPEGGEERPARMHVERLRNQDSSSSLDSSYMSSVCSEGEESGTRSVRAQLAALQTQLDVDLTDASSDEEGEESADPMHQHNLRNVWDDTRLALGSRWVWLQRRIAELNKQIYRLDHHMKESFSRRDKLAFAQPSPSKPILPPYFSITNGSMLEHLRTTNGAGGLIAMSKAMGTGTKPSGNNGFSHYTPHPTATGHAHCLPQLLLPEALLGTKLQVKDLLSPSHVERNILYVDETSCTAARTRALLHRPNRRVVRKKAGTRLRPASHHTADMAFHPQLSMAHELPSRIPLDCALKQVLSEHSYAQLPPLRKRRKAASSLPRLSTPLSQDSEHCHSASPSPVHTPHSLDSTREWSAHKKNSLDSSLGSPWSPGLSHSLTPGFSTPLQSNRKKRVTNSTPLFDIDNIVIPYSMAASTRLEKLEYKEILTPSWREVSDASAADAVQKQEGETTRRSPSVSSDAFVQAGVGESEEDVSDQAFKARHNRCELLEKKRFLNFISGGQRKRARPQSMTLSENGGPVTSPPLPPRRLTVASPSPSHAEPEVVSNRLHVVVLPWQPREFPLNEADQQALVNPPPPPPTITRPASPVLHTPSQTPSHTSSAVPTPAASPRSTPSEGTPAMSPAEWAVVNTNFPPALPSSSALSNNHCPPSHADSAFLSSPHTPLILKLTKKTC